MNRLFRGKPAWKAKPLASLSKRCFPGQEIVARMDPYGSLKHRLVGLVSDTPVNPIPSPGAKILKGDREGEGSVARHILLHSRKPLPWHFHYEVSLHLKLNLPCPTTSKTIPP
jgi:hypothetical protein